MTDYIYSKKHTEEKAVKGHSKNIKKRGGEILSKTKKGKFTELEYAFASKPITKKKVTKRGGKR